MSIDIVGPASADNAVTSRPSDGRQWGAVDTWFRDCSTPNSDDGTETSADWYNGVTGMFRNIIRANGAGVDGVTPVVPPDHSDNMAINAIMALFQRARPIYGVDMGAPGIIVAALGFAPAEILPGMKFRIKLANDVPGPTTINLNGLGTFPVTTPHGSPLGFLDYLAGDTLELTVIVANGALAFASVTPIHYAEVRSALKFTAGQGGTFPDLYAFAAWLSRRRISTAGSVALTLMAGKTVYAGGIVSLSHPDGLRVSIAGAAPTSAAPLLTALAANGNNAAVRATDTATNMAMVRTWLSTELDFQGSAGLDLRGIGSVSNLIVVGDQTAGCDGITLRFAFGSLSNIAVTGFAGRGLAVASAPGGLSNVFAFGCGGTGISIEPGAAFAAQGPVAGFGNGGHGVSAGGGVLQAAGNVGIAGSGNAGDGLTASGNGVIVTGQTAASFANFNANGISQYTGGKVVAGAATAANNVTANFALTGGDLAASNNLADLASIAAALSNLGFAGGIGTSGYLKIANGTGTPIILQWGVGTSGSSGAIVVPFPTAFPNVCAGVYAGSQISGATMLGVGFSSVTKTSFQANLTYSSGGTTAAATGNSFFWFAVGY